MNLDAIRRDFDQDDSRAYFNTALIGFPARSVWEKTLEWWQRYPFRREPDIFALNNELDAAWRSAAARLLNAPPDTLAGIPNTTYGMNLLASGIDWRAGDNLVITDLEFVAEYIALMHQAQRHGVEVRIARREGWGIPLQNVTSLIDGRTRVVALSHVEFSTGYRHDIPAIVRAAHAHGALLALDAIQSVGPLRVDVEALEVDFLVAGASKWMCALPGWGVLYAGRDCLERLQPMWYGFLGLADPGAAFQDFQATETFVKPYAMARQSIEKFRLSTENLLAKICMAFAMENFSRIGVQAIEDHVLGLSGYCMERLVAGGHSLRSVPERARRSGNVSFRPRREVADLLPRMERRGIYLCERGGGYRVSLHVYNRRDEIDRLIEAMDEECG